MAVEKIVKSKNICGVEDVSKSLPVGSEKYHYEKVYSCLPYPDKRSNEI